jgi:hypothetical protein
MSTRKRVLLLVGSAKLPRSTSESLGAYLLERLGERGLETETILLHRLFRADENFGGLPAAVESADLLVLAFPLYIDSLPYLVVRALELLARHRAVRTDEKRQQMACIVNCGFPEARHIEPAVAICRRFAEEAGFEWAGGLALGGGEMINGQPLQDLGGRVRNVIRSLALTADALADGKPVPEEAVALMARPSIPAWMYVLVGGIGWRRRARKYGAQRRLKDQPY